MGSAAEAAIGPGSLASAGPGSLASAGVEMNPIDVGVAGLACLAIGSGQTMAAGGAGLLSPTRLASVMLMSIESAILRVCCEHAIRKCKCVKSNGRLF